MARSKGTPKTNRVTVSLDDKTYRVLQAYSDREDVSISWLIRRAVADMVEQWPITATTKKPDTERKKA